MSAPNLLFLFTDEQRYDTLGAYGNGEIHTPNLDRLAATSTVFERAYVTQPVCTPSRATLLTGLYPHTSGCLANNVPLPADVPCLPEMLTPGQYVSGYHGKWHLGDEIFAQHGFDDWVSIEDMYRRYYSPGRDRSARSDYHHLLAENGFTPADGDAFVRRNTARLPEEFSKPAFLAREASRFIRENMSWPFILFVNFLEPHMPFFGPRDSQYEPDDIDLPRNFDAGVAEEQPLKARLLQRYYRQYGNSGLPLKGEADWRRLIANYWGLCSLVDTHVGTILNTLEDCGLWDETIILYTSDHGDMMGSHRLVAKSVMFEEAVRVPLLIRLPGQSVSRRIATPVSQVDLVPTLLDLMVQKIPPHVQGKSLKAVLQGDPPLREDIFIEWNGRDCGMKRFAGNEEYPDFLAEIATPQEFAAAIEDPVRTVITADGWKFNCSARGEHELYNLGDDPLEMTNLAGESESRPIMKELARSIRRWQARTGDTARLPGSLLQD
jgi:arylsulfatase